jgi:hypothetical protein
MGVDDHSASFTSKVPHWLSRVKQERDTAEVRLIEKNDSRIRLELKSKADPRFLRSAADVGDPCADGLETSPRAARRP